MAAAAVIQAPALVPELVPLLHLFLAPGLDPTSPGTEYSNSDRASRPISPIGQINNRNLLCMIICYVFMVQVSVGKQRVISVICLLQQQLSAQC